MKAIILAAGYATRLYPLTKNKSKCLIDIKGKPIVSHLIDKMEKITVLSSVYVVTNRKFCLDFEQWAKEISTRLDIKILCDNTESNEDRLGAIGDIAFAIEEERIDDDLLVVAGDNLFEFSLAKFYDFFMEKKASCVAAFKFRKKEELAGKFGVIETDDSFRIIGFEEKPEKPKTSIAATACYLFTKEDCREIIDYKKKGMKLDNSGDFIKYLSSRKDVYAFVFKEKWYDIGSFEDLGRARKEFKG